MTIVTHPPTVAVNSSEIGGWLTPAEGELLERHARACPGDAAIVEIGSFKGKSTRRLAAGSRAGNGARIFAVDPHVDDTWDEFQHNVRGEELITPMRMASEEAASDWHLPVGLLFIDGDHSREAVELDWRVWSPFLVEGAFVAFHDSTAAMSHKLMGYPGVRTVANRELLRSRDMRCVDFADTITYGTKGAADARDRRARRSVRRRKAVPDLLLLLNAYVFQKLPFAQRIKRLVFRKR